MAPRKSAAALKLLLGGKTPKRRREKEDRSISVVEPEKAPFTLSMALPADLDASELLRRFYLGRPQLTVDAYQGDLEVFRDFVRAPTVEDAVGALFRLQKFQADALAQEWAATMLGAPATRARRLGALSSLVTYVESIGVIGWKLKVKLPKVHRFRDTAGPGLQALQAMWIAANELEGQQGLRARAVLLLICTLGLRREEVAKLLVGNYDAQTLRLYVIGKGEKPVLLTVPRITAQALADWLESLAKNDKTDPLIQRLDKPGVRITGQAVYKIIAMLGKRANVRTWPHGLRHTAVTETTRMHGIVVGSQFARHEDVKTTMIYQDNLENLAGKAAESLAELFAPKV
jgi:integrase/recombinase XerC